MKHSMMMLAAAGMMMTAHTAMACEHEMEMPMTAHEDHEGHGMVMAPAQGVKGPVMDALEKANHTMHAGMAITYTGDADIDFVRGMIPHHQGAVDMAQVVLKYGADPQVRRMAGDVIRAQNLEIRWMKRYLAQLEARGAKPVPAGTAPKAGLHDAGWMGKTWLGER